MNINLRQISLNDDLEGLKVLQNIANDDTNMNESPVPKEIDEYLYKGFLMLSDEQSKNNNSKVIRYWITLDNKIIGYADIKNPSNEIEQSKIGNVGLILLKEYRNKGLGLKVLKILIEKTKKELNIDKVIISTNQNNIPMKKICEKINGELVDIKENCNYIIK